MKGIFPLEKLERIQTPFYYYDAELLWVLTVSAVAR